MTSEELRAVYTALGVSQARMAALLGMSKVSFARYVAGDRVVPAYIARLVVLYELVAKHGLTGEYLALVEDEPVPKRASRPMTPEQSAIRKEKYIATVKANGARLGRPPSPHSSHSVPSENEQDY